MTTCYKWDTKYIRISYYKTEFTWIYQDTSIVKFTKWYTPLRGVNQFSGYFIYEISCTLKTMFTCLLLANCYKVLKICFNWTY
jgi:hypothetical protein